MAIGLEDRYVAFVDILGFREKVKEIENDPRVFEVLKGIPTASRRSSRNTMKSTADASAQTLLIRRRPPFRIASSYPRAQALGASRAFTPLRLRSRHWARNFFESGRIIARRDDKRSAVSPQQYDLWTSPY
jgi:hypothetical protein